MSPEDFRDQLCALLANAKNAGLPASDMIAGLEQGLKLAKDEAAAGSNNPAAALSEAYRIAFYRQLHP